MLLLNGWQSFTSDSQRAAHRIRSSYNHKSCSRGDNRVCNLQQRKDQVPWRRCQGNPPAGDTASWPGAGSHAHPPRHVHRGFFWSRSYRSGAGGYHRKAFAARHIGSISSMRPCPRLHATPTPTPTATPSSMAMHTHFSAKRAFSVHALTRESAANWMDWISGVAMFN